MKPLSRKKIERYTYWNAISEFGGNLSETAKALGIGRGKLYGAIRKFNLQLIVRMARKRVAKARGEAAGDGGER